MQLVRLDSESSIYLHQQGHFKFHGCKIARASIDDVYAENIFAKYHHNPGKETELNCEYFHFL